VLDSVGVIAAEPPAMLSYVKKQTVTITIGVSFFVFGFFVVANLLKLTERDVLVGLISGAVGGVTMLATSLSQERRARADAVRPA
jgi:hypothetical protein